MNQSQNTYKSVTICIITNGGHVYFGCQMYTAHVQCESGQVKRTLSPYFRNLPLLHITIRLHLTSRLLKFMQWLSRKQYVLVVGNAI